MKTHSPNKETVWKNLTNPGSISPTLQNEEAIRKIFNRNRYWACRSHWPPLTTSFQLQGFPIKSKWIDTHTWNKRRIIQLIKTQLKISKGWSVSSPLEIKSMEKGADLVGFTIARTRFVHPAAAASSLSNTRLFPVPVCGRVQFHCDGKAILA